MSKASGVFICPSCQSMVQSAAPFGEGVTCDQCGHEFGKPDDVAAAKTSLAAAPRAPRDASRTAKALPRKGGAITRNVTSQRREKEAGTMSIERVEIPVKTLDEAIEEAANSKKDEETIMPDGSRRVRRHKKRRKKERNAKLVLFLAGWIAVIAIIFTLFKLSNNETEVVEEEDPEEISEQTVKAEVLRRFYPQVVQNFAHFLDHPTIEGREQFISNSADLVLPFTKHYQLNTFPQSESAMKVVGTNVIKLSEKDFGIETVWEDEDGNSLGAVHLWDGAGWKLDWENFAPYSSESWARFRSELGKEKGQFRLLARKRETSDESEFFYVSFYRPPLFFEEAEGFRATESPEVALATNSVLGREFLKLWNAQQEGVVPLDSILGKKLDPENVLRLNVILAWEENEQKESIMVLKDIVGVSWFGEVIQEHYREMQKNEQ